MNLVMKAKEKSIKFLKEKNNKIKKASIYETKQDESTELANDNNNTNSNTEPKPESHQPKDTLSEEDKEFNKKFLPSIKKNESINIKRGEISIESSIIII